MVGFATLAAYAFSVNKKAKRDKAAALAAEVAKNKVSFVGQDASGNWSVKDSGTDLGDGFTASYMRIGDSVQKLDTPVTYEDVYNLNGNALTENQIIQAGETRGQPIDVSTLTKVGQFGSDNKYNFFPFAQKIMFPEKEEPSTAIAADGYLYYTSGDNKGDRVFPNVKKEEKTDTERTMVRVKGLNGEFYYGESIADAKANVPPGVELDPNFKATEGKVKIENNQVVTQDKFSVVAGEKEKETITYDRNDPSQVSVTLFELNSQGEKKPDGKGGFQTVTMSGAEYDKLVRDNEIQGKYIPISEYRINPTTSESETISLISNTGDLQNSVNNAKNANNGTYIKFQDENNQMLGEFSLNSDEAAGSQIQGFLRNNPAIAKLIQTTFQGGSQSLTDDDINLVNFRQVIIPQLYKEHEAVAVKRKANSVLPLSDEIRLNTIQYIEETYGSGFFDAIPGLREEMSFRSDLLDQQATENILKKLNIDGSKKIVIEEIDLDDNMTIKMPITIPEEYTNLFNTVSSHLINKLGVTQEVADSRIASLVVGERTKDGVSRLVYDTNGNMKPAKNQPVLDFVQELLDKNITGYDSQFDLLMSMVKVSTDKNASKVYTGVNSAITDEIKADFAFVTEGNVDAGLNLIQTLAGGGSNNWKLLAKKQLGPDWKKSPEFDGAMAVSNAALNAKKTINSMISTYFTENGEAIELNTLQGSFKLHWNDVTSFIPRMVTLGANKLTGFENDMYMQNYNSTSELSKEQVALEYENTINRYTSVIDDSSATLKYSVSMEKEAQKKNKELLDTIIKESQSDKEITRKLAQRKYYKFMIAYQMAAAIQGGTGGRTISDQDVQNILSALNFGEGLLGLTSDFKHELATLEAARDMMDYLYKINDAKLDTSDPGRIFAAFKFQELTADSDLSGLSLNSETIARYIEEQGSARMEKKGSDITGALGMSEDAILQAYNTQRELLGQEPIGTFREIVQKLPKEELLNFINSLNRG